MSSDNRNALRDLRRTRKLHRLGDIEWFDVAYRVYLFALTGLVAVVVLSDAIKGLIGDDVTTEELLRRGPSVIGVAVTIAFGLGLRSGADGGPISIEVADIRHVLLAPLDRRRVLLRPIAQRLRASMFALALVGGVIGQLVAREFDGSRGAWAAAGAMFGAVVGATFVATAVIAHALRVPRWLATGLGLVAIGWQTAAAWVIWEERTASAARIGPANLAGSLAFWGVRQRGSDVIAVVVVLVGVCLALALGGRLRIEPLARRGELVTQLRFAATVQDLRTVVMLRRQLRAETMRQRPWGARRASGRRGGGRVLSPPALIWVRGMRSLRRLPASRIGRIIALAVAGGITASLTASASLLFSLGTLAAIFLLGMESIEPLSQEIDRPDLTDGLPVERGTLFAHHVVAPGLLLVVAGLVGATAAAIVDPGQAAAAFAIAVPVAWAGAIGPIAATVLDAPPPINTADTTILGAPRNQETSLVPPEFAGFSNAFSTLLPVILSALGVVPIIAMRADASAGTALRSAVGVLLALGMLTHWIRRRDAWGVKIRGFFEAGRAQQAGGSTT